MQYTRREVRSGAALGMLLVIWHTFHSLVLGFLGLVSSPKLSKINKQDKSALPEIRNCMKDIVCVHFKQTNSSVFLFSCLL